MTYLEAVNRVLVRLREEEVTTVNQNSYSKLIGTFINDAKRMVEDSWDWSYLRNTITVTTSPDVFSYNLIGTNSSLKTLDVINDTKNCYMQQISSTEMNKLYLIQPVVEGSPEKYTWNGFSEAGNAIVDVYPKPDAEYSLRFNVVQREDEYTDDADVFYVPTQAVIQLAQGFAMEERGDTGGQSSGAMIQLGRSTLSDAIALDAARFPSETIWRDV
jgi:hypothetical protein